MPPNTDTRIYSEVRLAGITASPQGEENPYTLLGNHSSLDVLSYLKPDQAAWTLYLAGRYSFRYYSTKRTRWAIERLEEIDPSMAERLEKDWKASRQANLRRGADHSAEDE